MNLVIPDWLALECVTLDRVLHLPAQLIDHGPHLTVTIDQVLHGLHRQARAAKPSARRRTYHAWRTKVRLLVCR